MGEKIKKIEQAGEKYDEITSSMFFRHYLKRRMGLIAELLRIKDVERALDLGCGTGTPLTLLETHSPFPVGLGLSVNALKKCKTKVLASLVRGNIWNIPFKINSFDLVLISGVLHHAPHKIEETLTEVCRFQVLSLCLGFPPRRSGGKLIIDEPNRYNPYWPLIMKKYEADPLGSEEPLDIRRLAKSFKKSGFNVRSIKFYGLTPDVSNNIFLHFFDKFERIIEKTFLSITCARFQLMVERSRTFEKQIKESLIY